MANILLPYVFPVTTITPTPAASTAFLKQACLVVKPKNGGVTLGTIVACTSNSAIAALTDNVEGQQLLAGGLAKVYILPSADLALDDYLEDVNDFFTLIISSDFDDENELSAATGTVTITSYANLLTTSADTIDIAGTVFTAQSGATTPGASTFRAATSNNATAADLASQINAHAVCSTKVTAAALGAVVTITAVAEGNVGEAHVLTYTDNGAGNIGLTVSGAHLTGAEETLNVGTFKGVVALYAQNEADAAAYAAVENRVGFFGNSTNKAKNMCYAFGKFLSATNFSNQQYISMPLSDGVTALGDANAMLEDKVSFVISDTEFSNRLALFAVGGKAIIAPYVKKSLEIDLQSAALSFISGNQPTYSKKYATLLENALKDVITSYIDDQLIEAGTVSIALEEDNFVASGSINISEPNALWIVNAEIRQTL